LYDDIITHDEEGVELPNEAAARLQALKGARDIIASQVSHGYLIRSHWIDVLDEQGQVVLHVTFGDAVEVKD
jgi:transcriptional accessory protein Tex/SPT6